MDIYADIKWHAENTIKSTNRERELYELWKASPPSDWYAIEVKRSCERTSIAYSSGALHVLLDFHLDMSEYRLPYPRTGELTKDDLIKAVELAFVNEPHDTAYWRHITNGGTLSYESWTGHSAEWTKFDETDPEQFQDMDYLRIRYLEGVLPETQQ